MFIKTVIDYVRDQRSNVLVVLQEVMYNRRYYNAIRMDQSDCMITGSLFSLINLPGSLINLPGSLINLPGSLINLPGLFTNL